MLPLKRYLCACAGRRTAALPSLIRRTQAHRVQITCLVNNIYSTSIALNTSGSPAAPAHYRSLWLPSNPSPLVQPVSDN